MGKLSGKQVCTFLGIGLFLFLLAFGTSSTGRRLAMSATQPFAAGTNFLKSQVEILFADEDQERAKLQQLEAKQSLLEQQARENQILRKENEQLRQTLALGQFPAWHVLRAEVLTRDPVSWDSTFTINRGKAEGVTQGAPVLFQQWMVGRIASVNQHSAVVHTLVSTQCRIGVKLQDTDFHGLLSGMGRMHAKAPGCVINYLPLDTHAATGNILVTSGLGGTIPEGIPLAAVEPDDHGNAIKDIDHARKQLLARPLAPWHSFRIVSLLLPN